MQKDKDEKEIIQTETEEQQVYIITFEEINQQAFNTMLPFGEFTVEHGKMAN